MPRVRMKRNAQSVSMSDKRKMTVLSDSINELQHMVQEYQAEINGKLKEMSELMTKCNVRKHEGKNSVAEMITPQGRAIRTINPYRFREKVTDEEFMESAKIQVGDAKKFLNDKELEQVSTVSKPKPKDPVLKVSDK